MIPMRQVFIVSNESNLKYPEGIACASVLEAGQNEGDPRHATNILKGILIGALFKGLVSFFGLIKGVLEVAFIKGNRIIFFGGDISPALVAVGFIVNLNVAILIFIGGSLRLVGRYSNFRKRVRLYLRSNRWSLGNMVFKNKICWCWCHGNWGNLIYI